MVKAKIKPDNVVEEFVKSFEDIETIKVAESFHKEISHISPIELLQEVNI